MNAQARNTQEQSMVEILTEEFDQIYYPGYTEELIASEPEKFEWELSEFKGQFRGAGTGKKRRVTPATRAIPAERSRPGTRATSNPVATAGRDRVPGTGGC